MIRLVASFCCLWLLLGYLPVLGQDKGNLRVFTLPQVVQMAKEQSPSFRQATVSLENRQWHYKSWRSNFLPQLTLGGTMPEFNKGIKPVLQNSGSLEFKPIHNASSSLNLALGQEVWFTGGYISINSQIQRIDDWSPKATIQGTQYSSVPATITLSQPVFKYNYRAWERKIQPLWFEEAKGEYWEDLEDIGVSATDHFFNLLLSQISYQIAEKNVANNDTLYKIGLNRYQEGKIAENELLQMELNLMNSRQNLEQAALDVESGTLRLKVFLGLVDEDPILLVPPYEIPEFKVDEKFALEQAHQNRPRMIAFKRQLIEADRQVAQAKGETGFQANFFASFGLNQQSREYLDVYKDPSQLQQLKIGFSMPVMDWGRTEARMGTAKANSELTRFNIEQQKINFDQDIYLNVKRFKVLRSQMAVAKRTDEVAERRYNITRDRYLKGQIGILDLNIATEERDKATRSYISALRSFWWAYHYLRRITLYDFESKQPISQNELGNQLAHCRLRILKSRCIVKGKGISLL
jgi:outer membrane protein TolC